MPCYDSRNEPDYVRAEAEKEWTHNSPVAELLCYVMGKLKADIPFAEGGLLEKNPALAQWWNEHQRRDRIKAGKEAEARLRKLKRK
jgi:hypothetical protein